jgi:hypothetical protein
MSATESALSAAPDVRVRPFVLEDLEAVLDLVCAQEFTRGQSRAALRRVFDHPWGEKESMGYVLAAGDRVVGCLGVTFIRRLSEGRERRYGSATTWYVDPAYRRHSRILLKAVLATPDTTLVALSASDHVARILEATGFEAMSRRRLFFHAWPLAGLLRRGPAIVNAPEEVLAALSPAHARIHRDHLLVGCRTHLLREDGRTCFLVTRRRMEKGWFLPPILPGRLRRRRWPVSDVFHVSDPALAVRHWAALRRRICRQDRSLGLVVEEAFLDGYAPATAAAPHRLYAYPHGTPRRDVDALYSELVLLDEPR